LDKIVKVISISSYFLFINAKEKFMYNEHSNLGISIFCFDKRTRYCMKKLIF